MKEKQAKILDSAARLLKPGGRLVYATCSLLEEENEAIAHAFTATHEGDFKPVVAAQALEKGHAGEPQTLIRGEFLRLWPHRHGTDGFFAAVWERC